MSNDGEGSVEECPGPGSGAWSNTTSRGLGCSTRIRINALRYDSRQEPYAVVPHVRICAGGGGQVTATVQVAHVPGEKAAQEAPSDRADHWALEGRSPHGSVPLEGCTRGQTARDAVRGRLQHPLAAADDCQEGGALLAAALFAPVPSRSPVAQLASHAAQTCRQRIQASGASAGHCLKANI